jgi:hypothetical protein
MTENQRNYVTLNDRVPNGSRNNVIYILHPNKETEKKQKTRLSPLEWEKRAPG